MSSMRIGARFKGMSSNLQGAVFITIAAFLFTVMTALVKILGEHLHVTQILLMRQCVMTIIILPAIFSDFPGSLRTNHLPLQFVRVAAAIIAMICGFTAIIELPLAEATALAFSKSFFVTIFAILVIGETVRLRRWIAVGIGFLGVMVMMQPGSDAFSIYSLYAIAGAAAAGFVMVLIRKMSQTDAPVTILTYQAVLVGIAVAVPGIWLWVPPTPLEWGLLVAMGFFAFAGQMMNIMAYRAGEASVMAILDYMRLIFATVIGFMLFDTLPGVATWIGSALVIGAAVYTVLREAKSTPVAERGKARALTPPH